MADSDTKYAVEIRITLGTNELEANARAEHLNDVLSRFLDAGEEVIQAEVYTY